MRWMVMAAVAGLPSLASADGIEGPLVGRSVTYDSGATQRFLESGRTVYNPAGSDVRFDSWGRWEMRSGDYCSTWPPSDDWACYALDVTGDRVTFIGARGDVTGGTFD